MVSIRSVVITVLCYIGTLSNVSGSTIVPPPNYGLILDISEAVVRVSVGTSESFYQGSMLMTRTSVFILETLKGPNFADQQMEIITYGGESDGITHIVEGSPRFQIDSEMVLTLRQSELGWMPWLMAYGQLIRVSTSDGHSIFSPIEESDYLHIVSKSTIDHEPVGSYTADQFLSHIRSVIDGSMYWDANHAGLLQQSAFSSDFKHNIIEPSIIFNSGVPSGCSFLGISMNGEAFPLRLTQFENQKPVSIYTPIGTTSSDKLALSKAMSNWKNIPSVDLSTLSYGGDSDANFCELQKRSINTVSKTDGASLYISFDDDCSIIDDLNQCFGVYAVTVVEDAGELHEHRGSQWGSIAGGIIVLNDNLRECISSTQYEMVLQHEIGHTLGFGHHTIESANMNAACCNPTTAKDIACAQFVYGNIALNPTPVITSLVPSIVETGTIVDVVVNGSGFMSESRVAIGGAGFTIDQVTIEDATLIRARVSISHSAIPSDRAFRVTNPAPGGGRSEDAAFTITGNLGTDLDDPELPTEYTLGVNYPNPFNPTTIVPFSIPARLFVDMKLIDSAGRIVKNLIQKEIEAGNHAYSLDMSQQASGIYFIRIETNLGVITQSINYIK